MKTGIVGAGAMGCIFGYFFRKQGLDVILFEKDSAVVQGIRSGLNVVIDDKHEVIDIPVDSAVGVLNDCGLVIIFVKTYSTEEAVKTVNDAINKDCIVLTLQNGLGNREVIARYIDEERVVCGSTSIGATRVDNRTVRLGGQGNIIIGGKNKAAVKKAEEVLVRANLDVMVTDDPDTAVWKKAVINAGINPIGALLSVPNGQIIKNDYSLRLQERIVSEAVQVAVSLGVKLDAHEMISMTRGVCGKTARNLCSMLQDVTAKRRTEIDSINGIIIEYGKKKGIDTPFNEAVYCLIKTRELNY